MISSTSGLESPRPYVMVSNHMHWIEARFLPVQKLARFHNYKVEHSFASTGISFAFVEFIVVKSRKQFAIIAVAGNLDMDGKVEIDEMMRPRMWQGDATVSEYTVEQTAFAALWRVWEAWWATVTLHAVKFVHVSDWK